MPGAHFCELENSRFPDLQTCPCISRIASLQMGKAYVGPGMGPWDFFGFCTALCLLVGTCADLCIKWRHGSVWVLAWDLGNPWHPISPYQDLPMLHTEAWVPMWKHRVPGIFQLLCLCTILAHDGAHASMWVRGQCGAQGTRITLGQEEHITQKLMRDNEQCMYCLIKFISCSGIYSFTAGPLWFGSIFLPFVVGRLD